MSVRDHLPLQQGLRLEVGALKLKLFTGTRPSSTTIRIKTMQYAIELGTRRCVRAHRPLQQGLRLCTKVSVTYFGVAY